ncbi:uncharacterized protein LOC127841272 [Dreissena polymorpha]|uniref:uncharacterized protein LOC127841272 n=1 Tax=Dreissena polymorpha TaxID=45954 RepID=UPI0022652A63|nr:uncharacterized protein LOC127841272 [Dreissena polymorpha]
MSGIYEMDSDEMSDDDEVPDMPSLWHSAIHTNGALSSPVSSLESSSQSFSLEKLLTEHKEHIRVEKEVEEIRTLLQTKSGGFINAIEDDNELSGPAGKGLQDQHARVLKQFHMHDSCMRQERPGMHVFHPERYLCNFDAGLHPCHCGFRNVNDSVIEKHVHNLEAHEYKQLLTKGAIPHCLGKIVCKDEFMRWMFLLMSVYEDQESLPDLLHKVIEIVHRDPGWRPAVSDICSILVNYGATEEELLGKNENHFSDRCKCLVQPNYKPKSKDSPSNGFSLENLEAVLQVLTEALTSSENSYCGMELNVLLHAVCLISLDVRLDNMALLCTIQQCVTAILDHYTEVDWRQQVCTIQQCATAILYHYTEVDWRQQRLYLSRMLGTMSTVAQEKQHLEAQDRASTNEQEQLEAQDRAGINEQKRLEAQDRAGINEQEQLGAQDRARTNEQEHFEAKDRAHTNEQEHLEAQDRARTNAHNMAHIVDVILPTERGFYLHRGMGYVMLHSILGTSQTVTDEELSNLEIQDLIPFIDYIDDLLKTDPYLLSSVILILGKCVGPNISLSPHEQEQLKSLMEKLKCIRVSDDLGILDRTLVKDMIARLTTRWNLNIQAGRSKQMRLFEFSSPAKKMKITQVQSLQALSDSDDDMEQGNGEMGT